MNIIVDSIECSLELSIAKKLANHTGAEVIMYDQAIRNKARPIKWILVGGPPNANGYKKLSEQGYTPDLVFCIKQNCALNRSATLEVFYDNAIITLSGSSSLILDNIIKKIHEECNARR